MEKVSSYAIKDNLSRLSSASAESQASTYTSRVNVSRLGSVNADAFVRNASLYSRIGGDAVVSSIVRGFYGKAMVDDRIKKFFDFADASELEKQIAKQIAFVAVALGGPVYEGMDMRKTREYLTTLGLKDAQFDSIAENLAAILRGQNMPPPLIDEMANFLDTLRQEVLG